MSGIVLLDGVQWNMDQEFRHLCDRHEHNDEHEHDHECLPMHLDDIEHNEHDGSLPVPAPYVLSVSW